MKKLFGLFAVLLLCAQLCSCAPAYDPYGILDDAAGEPPAGGFVIPEAQDEVPAELPAEEQSAAVEMPAPALPEMPTGGAPLAYVYGEYGMVGCAAYSGYETEDPTIELFFYNFAADRVVDFCVAEDCAVFDGELVAFDFDMEYVGSGESVFCTVPIYFALSGSDYTPPLREHFSICYCVVDSETGTVLEELLLECSLG